MPFDDKQHEDRVTLHERSSMRICGKKKDATRIHILWLNYNMPSTEYIAINIQIFMFIDVLI